MLALASGALALALAVGFAAPAPAAAADDELIRVIAPRDEGLASGGSVLIRVRLDPGAKLRSAKLNGAGIRRLLRPVGDGRELRVRLTRRDVRRLNHGRNFLRLVAARKKSRDFRSVVFTLVREARGLVPVFRARYERRHGLRVRLVTSKLRTKVRASLNGRDVSRGFGSELRAPRTVDLGAGDGLRHGRNVLKLTVTHFDGQIRRLRRVVNVPRGVTIAGTGRLRQLQQGGSARLDATSSRPALRLGGRPARGGLEYRWKIVARPRGSSPALSGARGSRPLLRADLPGRYRVQVATTMKAAPEGDHATTSYAEAEVEVEPQPFARVDTMASAAGSAGIAVEASRECEAGALAAKPPCFYPATNPQSTLQVVIVDRQDLTEVSNTSYSLADLGKFAADMEGLISNLGNKTQAPEYESEKLVLISSRAATVADAANLAAGLAVFNVDSAGQPAALEGLASAGPFSIVAAPGTLEGKTAINFGTTEIVAPDGTKLAPGAVVGAIKETQEEGDGGSGPLRSFAWPDALGYDTRAEGGKAFKIGTQAVTIVPEGKAADLDGIAVFTFDPVNPVGSVTRAAFVGNSGAEGSEAGLEWSLLASSLKSAYEKRLGIALVSNGDIGRFGSEPQTASFLAVQRWLEELQVNPDILARAVAANGTYSMVSAGVRPGAPKVAAQFRAGYSASSVLAEGVAEGSKLSVGEGRLSGVMQRTTYGAFFPNAGNPGGTPPEPGMLQVIYDKQVPWLLTPAPGASTASCQQLAFAYLTESIPGLFPNGPPDLWTGADASACEGIPHAAGGGVRSPDTLTGDECASTEAAASGANPAAVREASMALRTLYSSLDSEISETKISEATRPADAPFTEADLNCARKQMIDEISARSSVLKFMEVLEAPQEHTQQQTDTELGEIAEEVEVATLASIKAKIEDPEKSTGSFWAGFALQALGGATGIVAFNAADGGAVEKGARILEMIAGGGSTTLTLAQGPGGNPVALTDQYILLAAQLKEEQVKIEKQISDVLAAQQAGTEAAAAIMLADPGKLATVQTNVDGSWQIDAKALQAAQDAFLYRVRQLTYEAYWPQAYSAVRFSSKGLCHGSADGGCWNGSEWSESDPVPFEHASQAACSYGEEEIEGFNRPFSGADPGTPSGLGIGNEYQPLSVPVAAGTRPTASLDYVMLETQTLGEKVPRLADDGVVSVFFGQPQDGFEDPVKGEPGGFYAPEFWWRNLEMDKRVECNDESGHLRVSETGGAFQNVEESTDLWPVEPASYCAKKQAGSSIRATCTYDSDYYPQRTLNVGRLVEGLGGDPGKSPVWLQAFGGAGGFGGEEVNAGYGGAGGLARSYYESAASMAKSLGSPTLHFFLGEQGKDGSGAGGASTVVASEDITNGAEKPRPCIFEDPAAINDEGKAIAVATWPKGSCSAATQNVFLIAGGGGGGGHEAGAEVSGSRGRNGGHGGIAKATTKTSSAAGAAGESHKDSHRGYGGANGEGGKAGEGGHPESGEAGIGGQGGAAGSGGHALWFNGPSFFGGETRGIGGADGSGNGGHGGGGGGGFGGGAGGGAGGHSSSDDYGGSGGGGGGSYAFKGDGPPSENQPSAVAPGKNGSLVIVVDGLTSAGSVDVIRGCRFPPAGPRGATSAQVAYRNLGAGNRRAATCANARALAGQAVKRLGKQRFRSRGFTCRSQQPRLRAGQSKRTAAKRWTCVYRGKPGQSRVRFLTHR